MEAFDGLFAQTRGAFGQERLFQNARALATASILALGRHTVTGLLTTAGRQDDDWSSAYRLFERDRVDRAALFSPARDAVLGSLDPEDPLVVVLDDTLLRKRGRKVCGTSWKRDPLGPPFHTNLVWGQRFLQVSAMLPEEGGGGRARAIPIDLIHAPVAKRPGRGAPDEAWERFRERQREMRAGALGAGCLAELRGRVGSRRIVCAVDGGYTNSTVFRDVPEDTVLIGRIRKDARLYEVPGGREARRGRTRYYGEPLPTPEEIRRDEGILWQEVEAFAAGRRHGFMVKSIERVRWRGTGQSDVRLVVVRPLAYRLSKDSKLLYRQPAYLICTDPSLSLGQVIQAYAWRWEIECNFRDEKTVFGVGEAQVRTQSAVESLPALMVASYAYLLLAAHRVGCDAGSSARPKWNPAKPTDRCSTQQMVSLFRCQLWGIGMGVNKTHFAVESHVGPNGVFFKNSLSSAIYHARK